MVTAERLFSWAVGKSWVAILLFRWLAGWLASQEAGLQGGYFAGSLGGWVAVVLRLRRRLID